MALDLVRLEKCCLPEKVGVVQVVFSYVITEWSKMEMLFIFVSGVKGFGTN